MNNTLYHVCELTYNYDYVYEYLAFNAACSILAFTVVCQYAMWVGEGDIDQ